MILPIWQSEKKTKILINKTRKKWWIQKKTFDKQHYCHLLFEKNNNNFITFVMNSIGDGNSTACLFVLCSLSLTLRCMCCTYCVWIGNRQRKQHTLKHTAFDFCLFLFGFVAVKLCLKNLSIKNFWIFLILLILLWILSM